VRVAFVASFFLFARRAAIKHMAFPRTESLPPRRSELNTLHHTMHFSTFSKLLRLKGTVFFSFLVAVHHYNILIEREMPAFLGIDHGLDPLVRLCAALCQQSGRKTRSTYPTPSSSPTRITSAATSAINAAMLGCRSSRRRRCRCDRRGHFHRGCRRLDERVQSMFITAVSSNNCKTMTHRNATDLARSSAKAGAARVSEASGAGAVAGRRNQSKQIYGAE
jgi:hypothetical protein